jgi:predicted DNA-binding transcriptional regulator YafY
MPFNKEAYQRYKLIDARLRLKSKAAPSLQDLLDYVNTKVGGNVSQRTIQKDVQNMRYDTALGFNAPIEYDRMKKSYSYSDAEFSIDKISLSDEDLFGLDVALNILQQFKEIPAIKMFEDAILRMSSSVKKSKEQIVSGNSMLLMDHPNKYAGVQHMEYIVDAIRDKTELQVMYQSFTKPAPKKHYLQPYFIKEYHGRLYMIANDVAPGKMSKLLIFSFDRIKEIFCTTKVFKEEKIDKQNFFANTLGISNSDTKPEKIVLCFDKSQANYLKTQVLHSSQKIVEETDKDITVELQLVQNYELKMLVLGFGSKVKVKAPETLVNFIKSEIETARLKYF